MSNVSVQNLKNACFQGILQLLGKKKFYEPSNFVTKVMLSMGLVFRSLASLFKIDLKLKGYKTGSIYKDFGLTKDQKVLVFGDVQYDKISKKFSSNSN